MLIKGPGASAVAPATPPAVDGGARAMAGAPERAAPGGLDPAAWVAMPPRIQQGVRDLLEAVRQTHRSTLGLARALTLAARDRVGEAFGLDGVEGLADLVAGVSRRKTRALVGIWETYVERFRVPPERLAGLPWTKLELLRPVLTPESVESWLALGERLSLRLLAAHVRQLQRGEAPEPRVSKSFALPADAEPVLEAALEEIGRAANTDDRGRQLELLAAEGLGGRHERVGPSVRSWTILLTAEERARLEAALALTGAPSTAAALLWLAEHALACPGCLPTSARLGSQC